jgi:hypothetical protein
METELRRGQLVHTFLPHVDQVPMTLVPEGRTEPTQHDRVMVRLEPLRARQPPMAPKLPVAALPHYEGEVRTVYRAKRRPALIISVGGADVDPSLRRGGAKWQHAPTIIVAPYYGVEVSAKRGGWPLAFVERIRQAEYPQYICDTLPIGGGNADSILRLDHVQPVGRHHDYYEPTPHCLSDEALRLVDEWFVWLTTGTLDPRGALASVRDLLMPPEEGGGDVEETP